MTTPEIRPVTSVSPPLPEAQPMAKASIRRMIVSRTPAATAVSHSKNDACTSLGTPGGGPNLKAAIPVPVSTSRAIGLEEEHGWVVRMDREADTGRTWKNSTFSKIGRTKDRGRTQSAPFLYWTDGSVPCVRQAASSEVALSSVLNPLQLVFSLSPLDRAASLFRVRSRRPARWCPGGCASSGWLRVG